MTDNTEVQTRRRTEQNEQRETIEVRPVWYLSGHTMAWIFLNVISFGMLAMMTLGASLLPIALAWYRRDQTRYTLNGARLHLVDAGGFLGSEKTSQIPVRDVTDIRTKAGFIEKRSGVGTLSFREGDGAYSKQKLKGIPRHKELAEEIGRRQNEEAKTTRYNA